MCMYVALSVIVRGWGWGVFVAVMCSQYYVMAVCIYDMLIVVQLMTLSERCQ